MKQYSYGEILLDTGESMSTLGCPYCATVEMSLIEIFQPDENLETESIGFIVRCDTCYASGPMNKDERKAVIDWNTRYYYQDDGEAPWSYPIARMN